MAKGKSESQEKLYAEVYKRPYGEQYNETRFDTSEEGAALTYEELAKLNELFDKSPDFKQPPNEE